MTDTVSTPARRNAIFSVIAMALLMMSIDSTIVATALHAIQQGLDTSINLAGWTITAYSFGFVLMLPISGKLAERYGRRRIFIISSVAFTLASFGCGMADNIYVLIVLRALQAAGGAGFTPTATGIIVDHFGPTRDRYVSLFGSIFPVGAMIGPVFGGYFVTYASWRYVFFVNVPIGLAIFLLAWHFIPHDHPSSDAPVKKMDTKGIALLGSALLAGMLAATVLGEQGLGSKLLLFVALFLLAIVCLVLFFRHIRHSDAPFIHPRFIYGPDFGVVNLVNMIFSGFSIGAMALVPLYAINRYDISAVGSGTLLTAQGAAAMICSLTAVMLLRRTGYRLPLYVGSVVTIVGLILLAMPPMAGTSPYAWLAFAAFLVGAGNGTINPSMRNAGLQLAPESSSMLAALRTLSLQIGAIATISIVAAILAHQSNMGEILAWVYGILAAIRVVGLLLVKYVPEQRGAW
ncbi:MFS transporter [Pusillimonas sp. ANT_WB101]|uniref:MFS transporter n=1 Tax=Pusillimonas sp. ANT_WB101 TaxID=2597356 RepID=UPI0011EF0660|nr:MFS transporter [Pusillimonas sp. ANT_WB101]KAA0911493.1 MFS transporter [Pusillimonas sp. ANT_WB101]